MVKRRGDKGKKTGKQEKNGTIGERVRRTCSMRESSF